MTNEIQSTIQAIQILKFLPESERSEYYDSVIAPSIKRIGAVVGTQPKLELLTSWLHIQSSTMDLAVEGITEVTFEINRLYPQSIQDAISLLPPAQQTRLQLLLREFQGDENLPPAMRDREAALTLERVARVTSHLRDTPRPTSGVLGEFVGAETSRSSRGFPIIHGTFTLFSQDGSVIDNYDVNSGGGSPSYRTSNGPVPPGVYRVSNHRADRTTEGMVFNGVGYSFDVDPTDGTQVFGRSLFRIHPDGGNIGTNGCLGVRETATRLRQCEDNVVDLSQTGAFKILVRY